MNCPCCENQQELWLYRGNTVACANGHKFQIKPVGQIDERVLVLFATTPDQQHRKGSEFPIPKDHVFHKGRPGS
jgi:hypothetical protein